jgi:hypothetical protein
VGATREFGEPRFQAAGIAVFLVEIIAGRNGPSGGPKIGRPSPGGRHTCTTILSTIERAVRFRSDALLGECLGTKHGSPWGRSSANRACSDAATLQFVPGGEKAFATDRFQYATSKDACFCRLGEPLRARFIYGG